MLSAGTVRHECLQSLLDTLNTLRVPTVFRTSVGGPMVARARNSIAKEFHADTRSSHLLFVDSDMVFQPKDVETLLEADLPLVGGLYYGLIPGTTQVYPTCLRRVDDGDSGPLLPVPPEDIPEEGLFEVDATGAGFMLIRKDVLDALGPVDVERDWPFGHTVIGGRARGEDVTFCLRARERGIRTYVSADARIGHVKHVII